MKKIISIILVILAFSVLYILIMAENCQCEVIKIHCNGSIGTREVKYHWYCPGPCIIPYCTESTSINNSSS